MPFNPRKLRHRIDFQKKVVVQNTETGTNSELWQDHLTNVPAEIVPVSVREFIASQATQAQLVARIVIRAREGLDASMRIVHKGRIYNPQGFLADEESNLEYMTIPCSQGVNEG